MFGYLLTSQEGHSVMDVALEEHLLHSAHLVPKMRVIDLNLILISDKSVLNSAVIVEYTISSTSLWFLRDTLLNHYAQLHSQLVPNTECGIGQG
jgi:hypothetical protein